MLEAPSIVDYGIDPIMQGLHDLFQLQLTLPVVLDQRLLRGRPDAGYFMTIDYSYPGKVDYDYSDNHALVVRCVRPTTSVCADSGARFVSSADGSVFADTRTEPAVVELGPERRGLDPGDLDELSYCASLSPPTGGVGNWRVPN